MDQGDITLESFRSMFASALAIIGISLIGACGSSDSTSPTLTLTPEALGTVRVLGVWGGGELESFQAMIEPWEDRTGGSLEFEGTRDLSAVLRTLVAGGNPPDVAILPNPALMEEFAQSGDLQPLDQILDMDIFRDDYSQSWQDLGSVDDQLYGVFMKASNKSIIWYNPTLFQAHDYTPPQTWDELIALSDQMVQDGNTPWSIAVESAASSG